MNANKFKALLTAALLLVTALFLPGTAAATAPEEPMPSLSAQSTCDTWVHDTLTVHLEYQPGWAEVIVLNDGVDTFYVAISDFCILFGDTFESGVPTDTYTALSDPNLHTFYWPNTDEIYSLTATDMGYQRFFDYWHFTEGLF
jgi:hypothetical protein